MELELIRVDDEDRETIYVVECEYLYEKGSSPFCRIEDAFPASEEFRVVKVYGPDGKEADISLTKSEEEDLLERARESDRNDEPDYEED